MLHRIQLECYQNDTRLLPPSQYAFSHQNSIVLHRCTYALKWLYKKRAYDSTINIGPVNIYYCYKNFLSTHVHIYTQHTRLQNVVYIFVLSTSGTTATRRRRYSVVSNAL